MDLVLGLSMTSRAVRWVLVEGTTGAGDAVDHGEFDQTAGVDPDELLDVVLVDQADNRIHAIGVTWTNAAEEAASDVLDALTARGFDNVIAVSELEAGDVLAAGIASIAEYDDVAVCIVEPDAAVVAMVNAEGVTVDRVARPLDGADAVELPSSVMATLELNDWQPEAIFVVGSSDDRHLILSTLDGATEAPVISAAEAGLALCWGAALASARAVNGMEPARRYLPSRIGALTSLVGAAVVTFVAGLSAAIGLGLIPDAGPDRQQANTVDERAAVAGEPSAAQAATKVPTTAAAPSPVPSPREARLLVARTMVVSAPPAPAYVPPAPSYVPPVPAYTPPAPALTPPAPVYVPPVPQPRLRDRIIERIPIINRFHEPEYQYPR